MCGEGEIDLKSRLGTNSWLPGSDAWIQNPVSSFTLVTWSPTYFLGYLCSFKLWRLF